MMKVISFAYVRKPKIVKNRVYTCQSYLSSSFLKYSCGLLSLLSSYVSSNSNITMGDSTKVIIVGAGASGIAAASRLYENGITNILMLEAEDRIGGRVYTMDLPGEKSVIEIGAQWVHGEKDNIVYELASPRNLLRSSDVSFLNFTFVQTSSKIIDDDFAYQVLLLLDHVRTDIQDDVKTFKSVGDYTVAKVNLAWENSSLNISTELKDQYLEYFHQGMNSLEASDSWFDVSSKSLYENSTCEGDQNIAWKENGYRTIFSILTEKSDSILGKSLLDEVVIKNTEVVEITPNNKGVRVKCNNGKEYEADHVIVTVSLGVLQANHSTLFPPKLLSEQKVKAIENVVIGTVAKLYLKFPNKWWPERIGGFGLLWTKEDKEEFTKQGMKWITDVFAFMVVDNNPTMLCGWVVGKSAREMEQMDKEVVKTQLVQLLRKLFQNKYTIPEPIWFYRTQWKSNPHFRGTYTHTGVITEQLNISRSDLAEPILNEDKVPVILFAGEATNPTHYSTVHGAIETGRREADRILSLKKLPK